MTNMVRIFRLLLWALTGLAGFDGLTAQAGTVYLTEKRLATLRLRVEHRVEPNYTAWLRLKAAADAALDDEPRVPGVLMTLSPYKYPDRHVEVQKSTSLPQDTQAVFRLAVAWRITGEARYAEAAARLLRAWSTQLQRVDAKQSNTALTVSGAFPNFIIAADLLRTSPAFPPADQARFQTFLRDVILASNSHKLCMKRSNNWANFGVLLTLAAGAYLDDEALFQGGVARWKSLVESQISADGTLEEEVHRPGGSDKTPGAMGMWYSHFCLFPATMGAEVARLRGIDLYSYTSPGGKNLRLAYTRLVPWTRTPAKFPYYRGNPAGLTGVRLIPYWEMLILRWPLAEAVEVLREARPVRTNHCIPDQTFTHGNLHPSL